MQHRRQFLLNLGIGLGAAATWLAAPGRAAARPRAYDGLLAGSGWQALRGAPAPRFSLTSQHHAQESLERHRGNWLVLNFFATWCPACKLEMPQLETLHSNRVSVLAIAMASPGSQMVPQFVQAQRVTLPVLYDSGDLVGSRYGIQTFPTTYLISPAGALVGRRVGTWSATETLQVLSRLQQA